MGRDKTSSMGPLPRQAWLLVLHDLRQELREREIVSTTVFFTLVVLVMFGLSFASLGTALHPLIAPGLLWLCVMFVGSMTLTRIFDREREADTLRALLVAPVERLAIYLAKATVTLLVLLACMALLVPGLVVLFPGASALATNPSTTIALVVLGCLGYVAVGTLFAAGLATGSGKHVLLAVVLYPVTSPVLLFALVATRALLEHHPRVMTYLGQMAAVDVLLLVLGAWLFEPVLVGVGRARVP